MDRIVYRLTDDKGMRRPAVPAAPPFLEVMQCSQGFHVRHMILFEFAEVVASVLIQGDDAMSVAVCIFILEKGAFAAFAGSRHVLFVLWVIHYLRLRPLP